MGHLVQPSCRSRVTYSKQNLGCFISQQLQEFAMLSNSIFVKLYLFCVLCIWLSNSPFFIVFFKWASIVIISWFIFHITFAYVNILLLGNMVYLCLHWKGISSLQYFPCSYTTCKLVAFPYKTLRRPILKTVPVVFREFTIAVVRDVPTPVWLIDCLWFSLLIYYSSAAF